MKRLLPLLPVLAFVFISCTPTYFFLKGNLKRNYEAPLERAWEATLQSLEELNLATESTKLDAFGGEIKGEMADGTPYTIELKRLAEKSTEVGVRIWPFGDRTKSEAIYDKSLSKL